VITPEAFKSTRITDLHEMTEKPLLTRCVDNVYRASGGCTRQQGAPANANGDPPR